MSKNIIISIIVVSLSLGCDILDKPFIKSEIVEVKNIQPSSKPSITSKIDDKKIVIDKNHKITPTVEIKVLSPLSQDWYYDGIFKNKIIIKKGSQLELISTAILEDGSKSSNTDWNSDDNTIAFVNNGRVSVNKIGIVTITATSKLNSDIKNNITLEIVDDIKSYAGTNLTEPFSVEISNTNVNLVIGKSINIIATVIFKDGARKSSLIDWESSDTIIATVDQSGLVTGKSIGVTSIFARCSTNPTIKASLKVSVLKSNDNLLGFKPLIQ